MASNMAALPTAAQDKPNGHISQNGTITPPTSPSRKSYRSVDSPSLDVFRIWAPTLLIIFGGCCSNVYTLEALIQASPSSGNLLTAFQFLVVAIITLPSHIDFSRGLQNLYLKDRSIPLTKWTIYTVMFLAINSLNNYAFSYKISVPLHIILRSAGPVTTMLVGRVVAGRRYPTQKIFAVILLFVGVIVAALADSFAKDPDTVLINPFSTDANTPANAFWKQAPAFALLATALLLAALMGVYYDSLITTYGRSEKVVSESLFYSHALSLTYFASTLASMKPELITLMASPPLTTTLLKTTSISPTSAQTLHNILTSLSLTNIPTGLLMLIANALTQYICISGVNRLSAKSSSLTVSIVLNVRKLVSLVLSIWLFGNRLPLGVLIGAGMVFMGGGLYALPARNGPLKTKTEGKKSMRSERNGTAVGAETKKEL